MTTILLFAPLVGALVCGFGWRVIGADRRPVRVYGAERNGETPFNAIIMAQPLHFGAKRLADHGL